MKYLPGILISLILILGCESNAPVAPEDSDPVMLECKVSPPSWIAGVWLDPHTHEPRWEFTGATVFQYTGAGERKSLCAINDEELTWSNIPSAEYDLPRVIDGDSSDTYFFSKYYRHNDASNPWSGQLDVTRYYSFLLFNNLLCFTSETQEFGSCKPHDGSQWLQKQ